MTASAFVMSTLLLFAILPYSCMKRREMLARAVGEGEKGVGESRKHTDFGSLVWKGGGAVYAVKTTAAAAAVLFQGFPGVDNPYEV